jgi:hypothetical protein
VVSREPEERASIVPSQSMKGELRWSLTRASRESLGGASVEPRWSLKSSPILALAYAPSASAVCISAGSVAVPSVRLLFHNCDKQQQLSTSQELRPSNSDSIIIRPFLNVMLLDSTSGSASRLQITAEQRQCCLKDVYQLNERVRIFRRCHAAYLIYW